MKAKLKNLSQTRYFIKFCLGEKQLFPLQNIAIFEHMIQDKIKMERAWVSRKLHEVGIPSALLFTHMGHWALT